MKRKSILWGVTFCLLFVGFAGYGWMSAGQPSLSQPAWAAPPSQRSKPPLSAYVLLARYMAAINKKIQKNWDISSVPLMELHRRTAVVHLFINAKGHLIKFRISQSSGLKSFDNSIIHAVRKSHPFTKPPKAIRKILRKNGSEITIRRRVFRKKLFPNRPHYRGTVVVPNWRPRVMDRGVKKKKKKKK
ncbi:MAG: TonB C-terminal domain-containing protein [Deltaproteobacteria bacterium]|nr:MAG: TonB C-terminal domain-containing protein [Deltaproteobacteria bacterium]